MGIEYRLTMSAWTADLFARRLESAVLLKQETVDTSCDQNC